MTKSRVAVVLSVLRMKHEEHFDERQACQSFTFGLFKEMNRTWVDYTVLNSSYIMSMRVRLIYIM